MKITNPVIKINGTPVLESINFYFKRSTSQKRTIYLFNQGTSEFQIGISNSSSQELGDDEMSEVQILNSDGRVLGSGSCKVDREAQSEDQEIILCCKITVSVDNSEVSNYSEITFWYKDKCGNLSKLHLLDFFIIPFEVNYQPERFQVIIKTNLASIDDPRINFVKKSNSDIMTITNYEINEKSIIIDYFMLGRELFNLQINYDNISFLSELVIDTRDSLSLVRDRLFLFEGTDSVVITFKNLSLELLGPMSYFKEGEDFGANITEFEIEGNNVIIKNIQLTPPGTWVIRIQDKLNENKYLQVFAKVIQKPSELSLNDEVAYLNQETNENGLLTINVNGFDKNTKDVFTAITFSQDTSVDLTIDSQRESQWTLKIINPIQETNLIPEKQKVNFFYNDKNDYLETKNSILIFDSKTLPKPIVPSKIKTKKNVQSFEVQFSESIPFELGSRIQVEIVDSPIGCRIAETKEKIASITCQSVIPDKAVIKIKNIDSSESMTQIEYDSCEPPEINQEGTCVKCREINNTLPYYFNGTCTSACPGGMKINENEVCVNECPVNEFIQEGRCVKNCKAGYGFSQTSNPKTCYNCQEKGEKLHNNYCVSGCPQDTILNSQNECVVPEIIIGDENFNECVPGFCAHNETCSVIQGVPQCECSEEFIGFRCETEKKKASDEINSRIKEMFPSSQSSVDLKDKVVVGKIKSLANLMKQSEKFDEISIEIGAQPGVITSSTINTLSKIVKATATEEYLGVIDIVGLSLTEMRAQKKANRETESLKGRDLQGAQITTQEQYTELINLYQEYLKRLSEEMNTADSPKKISYFKKDVNDYIFSQIFTGDDESINAANEVSKENKKTIINLKNCSEPFENRVFLKFEVSSEVSKLVREGLHSNDVFFEGGSGCEGVEVLIPYSEGGNIELYTYYKQKGIDVYNKDDLAFTKPCYKNENFKFDLTQNFRKFNLYQNNTFVVRDDSGCKYKEIDLTDLYVTFDCEPLTNKSHFGYTMGIVNIDNESRKVEILPIKCVKEVGDISRNIAFWFFLVMFLVFIFFGIFYMLNFQKLTLLEANVVFFEDAPQEVKICSAEANLEDVRLKIGNFLGNLKENLLELHPILSLFHSQLLLPKFVVFGFFLFNIMNLFGFNALYFTETIIEDRIFEKRRDNFGYPMKDEFEKIMSAIVSSMCLVCLMRLICFITFHKKEALCNSIKRCKTEEEKLKSVSDYYKSFLGRIMASLIIMFLLNVFFFYYCVVFCGIYPNTQYGWFYSGIWSLFWEWVVFCNIYILIVTLVDYSGNPVCCYYMKRLFLF